MDEDETELRNPFPSPPSHYTKYTSHNLRLLSLFRERAPDNQDANQHQVLSDQSDVPDWPLVQLEKPRVDWILEEPEAYYEVFGDRWFVKEKIPSLAELGGNQLYPANPDEDRRPALILILRSLLVSYSSLTGALLAPPPPVTSNVPPNGSGISQNLMAAANDLRPVQARGNLELMMKRQLELRKEETKALHSKCDALEAKLINLKGSIRDTTLTQSESKDIKGADTLRPSETPGDKSLASAIQEDLLRWAEEIG
ncbi:MED7 protein-domain-containing protein [Infundibulicybe gibba]|nr:MED7 protein-domain-containing protein [Infundibulicybe gibba]